jgi:integrase/recombinase XerC
VGVGKAKRYGDEFIRVIMEYVEENDVIRPEDLRVRTVAKNSARKIAITQAIDRRVALDDLAERLGMSMEEMLEEIKEQSYEHDIICQRNSIIISLLYGCGIRLAELLKITLGDISDGAVKIQGKGNKERLVPLLPELEARIARYTAICRENGVVIDDKTPLIFGKSGKALSRTTVQRIVMQQMSSAGIQGRKSPHVLRHTFATDLLREGASIREIQELMGHSSLRSTQHYTHTTIRQLQGAYNEAHPHSRKKE